MTEQDNVTVSRELLRQVLDAFETYARQYPHMWKGYLLDAEQSLRNALSGTEEQLAAEPVTKIALNNGKYLKLEPFYFLGPMCWMLYTENDKQIRALDEFESGFVNAALKAAPQAQQP